MSDHWSDPDDLNWTNDVHLCRPPLSPPVPPVGFLRSGSKLLFRRRRRDKDPAVSQSHEDLSQTGEGSGPAASAPTASTLKRKSSGSFSRRLIKRFSFRSSGKSKSGGGATNGGAGAPGN